MYVEKFKSNEDVAKEYANGVNQELEIVSLLNNSIVHLAWYGYGDYIGCSWVIYENNGILYQVNGSHCSCYGLEGQWEPEETDWRVISMMDFNCYEYDAKETINEYVKALSEKYVQEDLDGVASIKKRMADSLRGI